MTGGHQNRYIYDAPSPRKSSRPSKQIKSDMRLSSYEYLGSKAEPGGPRTLSKSNSMQQINSRNKNSEMVVRMRKIKKQNSRNSLNSLAGHRSRSQSTSKYKGLKHVVDQKFRLMQLERQSRQNADDAETQLLENPSGDYNAYFDAQISGSQLARLRNVNSHSSGQMLRKENRNRPLKVKQKSSRQIWQYKTNFPTQTNLGPKRKKKLTKKASRESLPRVPINTHKKAKKPNRFKKQYKTIYSKRTRNPKDFFKSKTKQYSKTTKKNYPTNSDEDHFEYDIY